MFTRGYVSSQTSVLSVSGTYPNFTLCTSLNKVYGFIAVYSYAAKAATVDSVLLNTHGVKRHFLVFAIVAA